MKILFKLLFITIFINNSAKAQDSLVYRQKYGNLFSNQFVFYSNKTFEFQYDTDDGQRWLGKGTYKKFKDRLVLNYEKIKPLQYKFNILKKDTPTNNVTIRLVSTKGQNIDAFRGLWFKSQIDTSYKMYSYENVYPYDIKFVKIPVSSFKGQNLIFIGATSSFDEISFKIDEKNVKIGAEIIVQVPERSFMKIHYIQPKQEDLIRKGTSLILDNSIELIPYEK